MQEPMALGAYRHPKASIAQQASRPAPQMMHLRHLALYPKAQNSHRTLFTSMRLKVCVPDDLVM